MYKYSSIIIVLATHLYTNTHSSTYYDCIVYCYNTIQLTYIPIPPLYYIILYRYAARGMAVSALWLLTQIGPALSLLAREGYEIIVTGHRLVA